MLYLMKTCGHALARVGAIGRYVDTIKTEIELKQSLGLLPKQTQPAVLIQQNVTNITTNTEKLSLSLPNTTQSSDREEELQRKIFERTILNNP